MSFDLLHKALNNPEGEKYTVVSYDSKTNRKIRSRTLCYGHLSILAEFFGVFRMVTFDVTGFTARECLYCKWDKEKKK